MEEIVGVNNSSSVLDKIEDHSMTLSSGKIRRRWTAEEKYRYVCESNQPDMSISLVSRKYGIPPNRLYYWRKCMQEGSIVAAKSEEQVVPMSEHKKVLKDLKRTERALGRATMEREFLKEAVTYARKKKWISSKPIKGIEGFQ